MRFNHFNSFLLFFNLFLFILIVYRYRKLKIEKRQKERKELFESILKSKLKIVKENNSIIMSLIVPSQEFFYEVKQDKVDN